MQSDNLKKKKKKTKDELSNVLQHIVVEKKNQKIKSLFSSPSNLVREYNPSRKTFLVIASIESKC